VHDQQLDIFEALAPGLAPHAGGTFDGLIGELRSNAVRSDGPGYTRRARRRSSSR